MGINTHFCGLTKRFCSGMWSRLTKVQKWTNDNKSTLEIIIKIKINCVTLCTRTV